MKKRGHLRVKSIFKNSKKAQIAITDLFVSISIFIIILGFLFFILTNNTVKLNQRIESEDMQLKAFRIANTLAGSPGQPTGWEADISKLESIGLAFDNGVLDENKVTAFQSLNYDEAKSIFGISGYDFYFRLVKIGDESIVPVVVGNSPVGAPIKVTVEKRVLYKDGTSGLNEPYKLELTVWK